MCTLFEKIARENEIEGIEKGIEQERISTIERMIRAGATKEQIASYGYAEEEYKK